MLDATSKMLEKSGLNPTLNRIWVLDALQTSSHPLSAKEVFENVNAEHRLNQVTVYRILDLLADTGLVSRISSGERSYLYCFHQTPAPCGHCHFHCLRCGEVLCIENEAVYQSELALRSLSLKIQGIDIRLDGICPNCQTKA